MEPTLPSDVSKAQSHRWQTVAEVPEEKFEEYLAETKEEEETPTTAAVYRLAKQAEKEARREEKRERHEGDRRQRGIGFNAQAPLDSPLPASTS